MIREKLIDRKIGDNKKFRWRGHEITRIEGSLLWRAGDWARRLQNKLSGGQ